MVCASQLFTQCQRLAKCPFGFEYVVAAIANNHAEGVKGARQRRVVIAEQPLLHPNGFTLGLLRLCHPDLSAKNIGNFVECSSSIRMVGSQKTPLCCQGLAQALFRLAKIERRMQCPPEIHE